MQGVALRACGLGDWRYQLLPMPPRDMSAMLSQLRAEDCAGANVTIPYKRAIIPFLDEVSETAAKIGAVNTIVKRDDKLIGENTDAQGFLLSLHENQVEPRGANIAIFGAGGAAAAVAFALASAGARQLAIVNRTSARAVDLANQLTGIFPSLETTVNRREMVGRADIVVNATALGMAPHADSSPLSPGEVIAHGAVAIDLVYNPPLTRFMREASEAGARCIGGIGMLVYQGAISFHMWTGLEAPVEEMMAAAEDALQQQIRGVNAKVLDSR